MSRPTVEDVRETAARNLASLVPSGHTLRANLSGLVVIASLALWLVLLGVAVFSVPGCLPPQNCAPGTASCEGDVPRICASTGREWAVSSPRVRCAEVGGVCRVQGGVAACLPPDADGGAP